MKRVLYFGALAGFMAAVLPACHVSAAVPELVIVNNGSNTLDLGSHAVLAVRARRENYNAHGFDVVTFYFVRKGRSGDELNLVPIFGDWQDKDKERDAVTVGGGADCLLHDFRLIQAAGKRPARLIVAERDFGDSYVAPGTVHFTYYELAENAEETPGRPPLYFQASQRSDSRQKYCDVDEAFDRELHLDKGSRDQ